MKALVTGATGFVGKALLRKLASDGVEVKLLVRRPVEKGDYIVADFLHDEIPSHAFESVDTVFHLAGFAHDLRDASKMEAHYRAVNVLATEKLANLAAQANVKHFVFVSSVKAGCGGVQDSCLTEQSVGEPEGVYGRTKREAELALIQIARSTEMKVSIVRPALVYGPGVKGNLAAMLSAISKGWFPPLPDIQNKRSMIHVDDLILALLCVASRSSLTPEIYIATDGKAYSSRQIYETLCRVIGRPVPYWAVPKVIFDIVGLFSRKIRYKFDKLLGDEYYSNKKISNLGFVPQRSLRHINETYF